MKTVKRNLLITLFLLLIGFTAFPQEKRNSQILKRSDSFFGVHFDLHASEDITDAGKTLTRDMVDTFLKKVRPDFIQIDCKGHPGISSYPTIAGNHVKGFAKDPLKLFREVTRSNNVALYMHYSGVWDSKAVALHPSWDIIRADGRRSQSKTSFFSPYLDSLMIPQLKELSSVYGVDGAWIDGECWAVEPDFGAESVRRFTAVTGITEIPKKPGDRYWPEYMEFTRSLFRDHLKKYINAIHEFNPSFQITSNWAYSSLMPEKPEINVDFISGDVTPQNGVYRSAFEARCIASQGKPWDLMAWGFSWDGGKMPMSIKSAVQLKQEAAEIISMGGGVQFYFQQNNDLSIKPWLAPMLADIAGFCRARQPYCHKATQIHQVALLYPSGYYSRTSTVPYSWSTSKLQGALYSLLDCQLPVEILMEHSLAGHTGDYPVIVVPECNWLQPELMKELHDYVKNGGNLLVIGHETASLFSDILGIKPVIARDVGEAYISASGRFGTIRSSVLETVPDKDCQSISEFYTGRDFTKASPYPSATMNRYGSGKAAAIYFDAGEAYSDYRSFIIRDFIAGVMDQLFTARKVIVSGSHLVHISLNSLNSRLYLNLVNVSGDVDGRSTIGYDEIPSLNALSVTVKTGKDPVKVILQPEGKELEFKCRDGMTSFSVPSLAIHSVIEIF